MQDFSHRLTQKLLHPTSILLRDAAKADDPAHFGFMREHLEDTIQHIRQSKR